MAWETGSMTARPAGAALLPLVVAAVACSSAVVTDAAPDCPPSPFRSSPPQVIAHSGGEGLGPANSLVAIARSLAAGADIVDVDVRMTADGVVVATHDRDVATTTDGTGNVDELTWDAVQQLDARAAWAGDPIASPVRIPSLQQVLDAVPEGWVSVEIKQTTPPIGEELCAVLRRAGATDRVYLSSNVDEALFEAHERCPEVLITTTYRDLDEMRAARESGRSICAPAPIGQPPYREFDAATVAERHAAGTALFTWTVDDPDQLRHLAEVGIDGVYTRRPDIARTVFDHLPRTPFS
jgi:glycerophosphoryl diester phosphodiesterase